MNEILIATNILSCAFVLYSALRERKISVELNGQRFECGMGFRSTTVKVGEQQEQQEA